MQLINITTHISVAWPQWVNAITCHRYLHKNYKLFVSGMFMAVLSVWKQLIMSHEQCCGGNYLVPLVAIRLFSCLVTFYSSMMHAKRNSHAKFQSKQAIFTTHKKKLSPSFASRLILREMRKWTNFMKNPCSKISCLLCKYIFIVKYWQFSSIVYSQILTKWSYFSWLLIIMPHNSPTSVI